MMLRILRPLFPLLLLLLAAWGSIVVNASMAANAGTCVMDVDGNCMDDEATSNQNDCQDAETACQMWAESGECEANPKYMLNNCRVSCETCSMTPKEIQKMIDERLEENTDDMDLEETPWGVAQDVEDDDETRRIIAETEEYMKNVVFVDPKYESVKDQCKNRNSQCAFWASSGECEANPAFMTLQCAPVCQTCEKISFEARCPWDPETTPNALKPGDLNKLFERLTTDPHYSQYKPVIHSRPEPLEIAKNGDKDAPVPKEGPWVVTLDDFVTEEECNVLINHGAVEGYEISEDVGEQNFDGTYKSFRNSGRTSTNAWCNTKCYEDPIVKRVLDRIVNGTGVPEPNNEFLQLLRYDIGQFYQEHHDYIEYQIDREEGVRILTVYLYLTDVEAGGGTRFPGLDITSMPKRGKALIWPSVLNEDPNEKDERTNHQALPVIQGLKYGANAWVHQRDFKGPYNRSCI